ncbi:metalloregulator ArsR/SmtB family transcription factor [Phyllobacterium sp. SYP-B3895]|uniref:ArsR/SmtB family transcription factor n=1 Tax=Phyllobacterium sp. SYP-B3895 TaxID=2663240 RepID=UPI001299C0AB|nr:metalloregulator ArsR/SmtB family transcription factor [Phyllobacterium sp. SYP-B3895]MRG56180.1 metalloregulator ArsR/SmtB family transcription factor [Phyllobacterium sp. SYP-B3895]
MEQIVFKALADPTRRAIFEKLATAPQNATELRQGFGITQPAMSQHLSVLREARLLKERREGRFTQYEVEPDGLLILVNWLAKYRTYWPDRAADLADLLKEMDQ